MRTILLVLINNSSLNIYVCILYKMNSDEIILIIKEEPSEYNEEYLKLEVENKHTDTLLLKINDTSCKMDNEYTKNIFDKFCAELIETQNLKQKEFIDVS